VVLLLLSALWCWCWSWCYDDYGFDDARVGGRVAAAAGLCAYVDSSDVDVCVVVVCFVDAMVSVVVGEIIVEIDVDVNVVLVCVFLVYMLMLFVVVVVMVVE